MNATFKIGILVDGLRLPLREGLLKAKELGADGVQIYATKGEMHPDNIPPARRKELRAFLADIGLELSALVGDFDWVKGFTDAEFNRINIPRVKKVCDLARDLGTNVVTMHIGKLPDDSREPAYQEALSASAKLGRYAESVGVVLCSETGPEAPVRLREFLRQIPGKGVGVNYDPANLVMCGPFDHIGGVDILKEYIHHTHAKDGVCLGRGAWQELPLGQGGVVFPHYLAALQKAGYRGYLTIEREGGSDRVGEIGQAVKFLRGLLAGELPTLPTTGVVE